MPNKEKPLGKRLKKFSIETRLKSANDFRAKLLGMFKDYIKSIIVFGAIVRGDLSGKSDVDLYIIFDDTKFPLGKFNEIREKIDNDVLKAAESTDPRLHPQPILALTEFWDGIRNCHPLFYTIVKDGYAIYDTGFFIPMRKLLEWGKFPATTEAAEQRMESVPKRIERVKNVKLYMIAEDIYQAMVDAAQALLMYIGIAPPAPKPLPKEVRKHLVESGLMEEEYAKMLEDVIAFRKGVEHKEIKKISGSEVDKWIKKAERYVERLDKLLKDLEKQRKVSDVEKSYEVMVKASVAALKAINKLPEEPKELPNAFKKYLIEAGLVNPRYGEVFNKAIEMRKLLADKQLDKISERDVYMNKEYVRRFIADVQRVLREKGVSATAEAAPQAQETAEQKIDEAKKLVATAKEVDSIEKKEEAKENKEEKAKEKTSQKENQ